MKIHELYIKTTAKQIIRIIYSNKLLYKLYKKIYPILPIYESIVFVNYDKAKLLKGQENINQEFKEYGENLIGKKLASGHIITGYELVTELTKINSIQTILENHLCLQINTDMTIVFSHGSFLYNENQIVVWQEFYSIDEIIDRINSVHI